jgi:hypothetical protein
VNPSVPRARRDSLPAHEVRDLARRLGPDLLADDPLVRAVLAERLHTIALGQVDLDELALGALAERLCGQHGQAGLDRQTVPTGRRQTRGQAFEGVQPELVEPLPVDDDPLVRPVRQDLGGVEEVLEPDDLVRLAGGEDP